MLRAVLMPLVVLSAVGGILSLCANVVLLFEPPLPFHYFSVVLVLAVGLMVVSIPAILCALTLTRDFEAGVFFKAVLRGCPMWMRRVTYATQAYFFLAFVLLLFTAWTEPLPFRESTYAALMAGGLSAPYSSMMATMYCMIHVKETDRARRCMEGHPLSPSANFCERCGAPVQK